MSRGGPRHAEASDTLVLRQGSHSPAPIQTLRGQHAATVGGGGPGRLANHVLHERVGHDARSDPPMNGTPRPVGPRGDLQTLLTQDPARPPGRVTLDTHGVDEPHDHPLRGSNSPTKKDVAAFSTAPSLTQTPVPRLQPADLLQLLTAQPTRGTPSCLAIATDAAVTFWYSPRCSRTSRPARALRSGPIFFGMCKISLDSNRSGINPGTFRGGPRKRRPTAVGATGTDGSIPPSGHGRAVRDE